MNVWIEKKIFRNDSQITLCFEVRLELVNIFVFGEKGALEIYFGAPFVFLTYF